eukprot:333382-Amphidinium_carterae.2
MAHQYTMTGQLNTNAAPNTVQNTTGHLVPKAGLRQSVERVFSVYGKMETRDQPEAKITKT